MRCLDTLISIPFDPALDHICTHILQTFDLPASGLSKCELLENDIAILENDNAVLKNDNDILENDNDILENANAVDIFVLPFPLCILNADQLSLS